MSIWGKLAGAATGFAFGGPLGALLGGIAGHIYDQWREERRAPSPPPRGGPADPLEARRLAFATALIVLAAKLAKADGRVSRDEIRAFRRVFRIGEADRRWVAEIYNRAKRSPLGFEPYARQIAEIFARRPAVLEQLLDGLFAIAAADGVLHPAERDYLSRVAALFGFSPAEFEAIEARWRAGGAARAEADDPYVVLGLSPDASIEEIRRTYRRLVREHHPDRLIAQGMPEEFVRRANARLAAINAAYDRIAEMRGIH